MLCERFFTFVLLIVLTMAGAPWAAAFAEDATQVTGQQSTEQPSRPSSLEADVQPLLRAKCARCHAGEGRKADLDLTSAAGLFKGGESGPVIVPGKPDESLLFEKIRDGEMPPDEKDRLSEAELKAIERWIVEGAKMGTANNETDGQATTTPSQHDVIPILLRRCSACHGRNRQEAGLDLRTKVAMLRGGKSGPAMVPGKAEDSLVVKKVKAGEMPPRDRLVEASVKPIEPAEIEVLSRWIEAGAPEIDIEPDIASTTPDPLVSDQDRDFWAFRPPQPVVIPDVRDIRRIRNPIDAFIEHSLKQKGLAIAPEADRLTILRRASFDLTGLPPEPDEVDRFLIDSDPQAYERLIDRLLASPRYGERWARYWLDAAGYAESEGKREQDLPRPNAWRYRDYVIRSLNADKPFDQFLVEQLAGDELVDYEHTPEITDEIYDNLVATGFLRMAPDATWANITGYLPDRIEVMADEIDVLGSAVMGLTLKCARCHSHKFDPIPHRDYYRLVAVFKGAYDEHNWLKPDVRPGLGPVSQDVVAGRLLSFVTTAERRAWEAHEARLNEQISAAKQRSAPEAELKALETQHQPEPHIQALWDRGKPSDTYVYRRGDPFSPGRLVGPGVPSVLTDGQTPFDVKPPWPGATQTGRRLAFARWLTRPDHPLTARVAVNRLWKHHFGSGIVKSLGNFGKAGTPPTHPELLDWLARDFVRQGWSMKAMHRLIMTSAVYRQSSAVTSEQERLDPDNTFYSRMPLVRLDAEALYDSLLVVAGRLDETRYGRADVVGVRPDGLVTPEPTPRGWRRLIYVEQTRKKIPTHLENFDYPQMNPNCIERRESMVAPQALHLMNNGMVFNLAEQFATRVLNEASSDPAKVIDRVYLIALSRYPSDEEKRLGLNALNQLETNWAAQLAANGQPDQDSVRRKALTAYCHAIVNSAAFLYVD